MHIVQEASPTALDCGLDMDLNLAASACMRQLPALLQRRLRARLEEVALLQALLPTGESAQRLGRKLFGALANASVHGGGADTQRPLWQALSQLRVYLHLRRSLPVEVPEVLRRGTPDLVATVDGVKMWIDCQPRSAEVLEEAGTTPPRLLVLDRTASARREPPLRLGQAYLSEFHLLRAGPAAGRQAAAVLERQPVPGDAFAPAAPACRFQAATGARASRGAPDCRRVGLEA